MRKVGDGFVASWIYVDVTRCLIVSAMKGEYDGVDEFWILQRKEDLKYCLLMYEKSH